MRVASCKGFFPGRTWDGNTLVGGSAYLPMSEPVAQEQGGSAAFVARGSVEEKAGSHLDPSVVCHITCEQASA